MRFALCLLALTVACLPLSKPLLGQKPNVFDDPTAAKADPDFAIQGEYEAPNLGLQVIAEGDGAFELVLYQGGLPGAGWDRSEPRRFDGDSSTAEEFIKEKKFAKVERKSPTLGAKPPAEAIVLFDGTKASLDKHWKSGARITEDGLLMQGATSIDTFGDYVLHVEFRTPFQPKARGQGRGNSGVYHQGRYETQVLDSFGLVGKNNETGGIYSVRDPDMNLCFPPLQWQTYDVEFTAATFDADGKKQSDARITVKLNGVVVQNETKLPNPTTAAPFKESKDKGPIYLQDHGNPVRFRNIWVVPRDAAKEALRPRLPTLERVYGYRDDSGSESSWISGRILASELHCASCHSMEAVKEERKGMTAPILDRVGTRIRFDYLLSFLARPHSIKPGTRMPDLLHGLSEEDRSKQALALASFLASTGSPVDRPGDEASAKRGEKLYQTIGCAMCHSPKRQELQNESTSIPLGDLTSKYTLDSLSRFLVSPHSVRPSGQMPKLVNDMKEARDVACFLLGKAILGHGVEEFDATVYHGSWDKLPDFDTLTPVKRAKSTGLDLAVADRKDQFGIRFESYLPIDTAGTYTFRLGSDDGSRLVIDEQEVVRVDGIHAMQFKNGKIQLEAGIHRIRIEYFENAGGEELSLEMESREWGRVPIASLVTAHSDGKMKVEIVPSRFQPDPQLVAMGKELFQNIGCAQCHSLQVDGVSLVASRPLMKIDPTRSDRGCLSAEPVSKAPNFALSSAQRQTLRAFLRDPSRPLTDAQQIDLQLTTHHCVACHQREGLGGPEASRDPLFTTRTQEMGNEGRVPPPLTGVGDKLKREYLERILVEGSKDRPYMLTRMPAFSTGSLHGLAEKLEKVDRAPQTVTKNVPNAQEDLASLQSNGRKLVGSEGLSCVKCHAFGNKAQGIAAMDLRNMADRLREDWFVKYMREPSRYRPGTRMPQSFPDGKSVLDSIYEGNADKQIQSMWSYLALGEKAREPLGVDAKAIVLKPDSRPVLYRNFIEGLGPRGIAVGYPEHRNLAWDAGSMGLTLLWKEEFIDASRHWVGRGQGFQAPLGEEVLRLEEDAPLAILNRWDDPWPKKKARERGYQFLGIA